LALCNHSFDIQSGPIVIEDDVWIGFGASILGSVHVGRGAVIGAGTIVTKDVPAYSLVVGNPMRVVRQIPD
jgi:acetyltransferase-like isoleucine patch superfamily enzyme